MINELMQATDALERQLWAEHPKLAALIETQVRIVRPGFGPYRVYDCGEFRGFYGTLEQAQEARRAIVMQGLLQARAEIAIQHGKVKK